MRMNLLYVHSPHLGYGRMGVKLAAALERGGVEVCDDMPSGNGGAQKFIPHTDGKSGICGHAAWLSTPGHCRGWWKGQSRSILTMWESTILPEPFRESLDAFDVVVCPSEQNQELFGGYHKNVHFVPLGIDPTEWYPVERPRREDSQFTFLISGGGYRKGGDLAIDAFRKVFGPPAEGGPRLFFHSARMNDIPNDPRIHLITGRLTTEEERVLYGMAHAYVQPSRGEGFGLRPLQAIAQGCPTIATNAHGHASFGDLITYPLGWKYNETPPRSFHHGPAGMWWEPDFDQLCEAMWDVYNNYDEAVERARPNALRAGREFSWDETARKYLDAIGRENLEQPDILPTQWVEPPARRYLVRVNERKFFEVGGVQYWLEPGRDYWEPADVKRVLFESGSLEPSCLSHLQRLMDWTAEQATAMRPEDLGVIDTGLTPEQVERIPDYTGSRAYCPTCSQKLNTNRPTLEEIEALPMPREAAVLRLA